MPDTLNKQSIINLLIDSPLREPIKINLIDIVNNTSEPDLPKVYTTITKELEIFQKATERRMKLADETIAKLGGAAPATTPAPASPVAPSAAPMPAATPVLPPLDLPPLPAAPVVSPSAPVAPVTTPAPSTIPPLSVPPLDLPPLPTMAPAPTVEAPAPATPPAMPPLPPLGAPVASTSSDEDALAEIQKELDSLKSEAAADISTAAAPAPAPAK